MEHGTESVLLDSAFSTMKTEDHQWSKNIQDALGKIGTGDVLAKSTSLGQNYTKKGHIR